MKIKHHKQIIEMLYNEWDLGKVEANVKGRICAWIYWFGLLSYAEKIILEKHNDNIIGLCMYSKWSSNKYIVRKKYYKFLKWLLIHTPLIKNKEAIYKYDDNYDYLPKELENYFDGEITLLIVDKEFRGKNIGKKLLEKAFNMAIIDNMKNIQILSDESCNYKFYENMGCSKIYETIIYNEERDKCGNRPTEKAFIYEKKLNVI